MTSEYSQVPIIQCSYQLSLDIQRSVARFPKNLRYQLGDRLASMTLGFFERVVKANFVRDPGRRFRVLDELSAEIFTIRMTLRMAKDLKCVSVDQYTEVNARVEDIQKQLTGWTKWTQTKVPQSTHIESAHHVHS